MKTSKRFSSLLLALIMCLALLPAVPAAAEEEFVIRNGDTLTAYNGPGGAITIPEGVKRIGNRRSGPDGAKVGVFQNNRSITEVTLPASLESTGQTTFSGCTNLAAVHIPADNALQDIGQEAFAGCTALTRIELPARSAAAAAADSNEVMIWTGAFRDCTALEQVVLAAGERYWLWESAFAGAGLTEFTLPDSGVSLEERTNGSIIQKDAFLNCTRLQRVSIAANVNFVSPAFSGCAALTEVDAPTVEPEAFAGTPWYERYVASRNFTRDGFTVTDGELTAYDGPGGAVTVPEGVAVIADNVFTGMASLTELTLPTTLERIGDGAFQDCVDLKTVHIPADNRLTEVGYRAFAGCSGLTRIEFPSLCAAWHAMHPDCYVRLGSSAFSGCTALTEVALSPDESYKIDTNTFFGCVAITEVDAPGVDPNIFQGTPWYENRFTIGDFTVVDGVLTQYNGEDTEIVIPGDLGIREVRDCKFPQNTVSLTFPEGVEVITGYWTNSFPYLKELKLPDSLRYLNDFYGCEELTKVVLPENVILGSYALCYCRELTDVTLPDSAVPLFTRPTGNAGSRETVLAVADTLEGPLAGTPFLDAALARQADGDFVMLGSTLVRYQGAGGDVTIPENVRYVTPGAFLGHRTVTSITYPEALQEQMDGIRDRMPEGAALRYFDARGFYGCVRLTELVNQPYSELDRFWGHGKKIEESMTLYRQWVNPAACLKPQSARITAKAAEIVAAAGAVTDMEKTYAIAEWVARNMTYGSSGHLDSLDDLLDVLRGVCGHYAVLTVALLRAQNIPAQDVLYIEPTGLNQDANHAWTEAFVDGYWLILDDTWMAPINAETGEQSFDDEWFDVGPVWCSYSHSITERDAAKPEDTPSAWAQKEVFGALGEKLVPADLQSAYRENITREDFCRLMVELLERVSGKGIAAFLADRVLTPGSFTDSDDPAVLAANALGIVDGRGDGIFDPASSIKRQEAAAMLTRTARVLGLASGGAMVFSDTDGLPAWAADSIAFISGLTDPTTGGKVMNGTGNDRFSPFAFYTREQAILTALRLLHSASA